MRLLRQTFFLTVFMADVKPLGSLRGCRTGRACPESPRLFPHRMPWSPHDGGGGWLPSVASVRGQLPLYCFRAGHLFPRRAASAGPWGLRCRRRPRPVPCLPGADATRSPTAPTAQRNTNGCRRCPPPPFPSHPAQPIASEVCWLNTCFIKVQSPLQMGVCLEEASF